MNEIDKLADCNKIVIIGYPKTGKTTFTNALQKDSRFHQHAFYHTDDYLHLPYREQLYALMDDMVGADKYVVEGVQGYRLLRKIEERDGDRPNIIVTCVGSVGPDYLRQAKGLDTVWKKYLGIRKIRLEVMRVDVRKLAGEKGK